MRQDNKCQVMSSEPVGENEQNPGGINLLVGKSLRKQGSVRARGEPEGTVGKGGLKCLKKNISFMAS